MSRCHRAPSRRLLKCWSTWLASASVPVRASLRRVCTQRVTTRQPSVSDQLSDDPGTGTRTPRTYAGGMATRRVPDSTQVQQRCRLRTPPTSRHRPVTCPNDHERPRRQEFASRGAAVAAAGSTLLLLNRALMAADGRARSAAGSLGGAPRLSPVREIEEDVS